MRSMEGEPGTHTHTFLSPKPPVTSLRLMDNYGRESRNLEERREGGTRFQFSQRVGGARERKVKGNPKNSDTKERAM